MHTRIHNGGIFHNVSGNLYWTWRWQYCIEYGGWFFVSCFPWAPWHYKRYHAKGESMVGIERERYIERERAKKTFAQRRHIIIANTICAPIKKILILTRHKTPSVAAARLTHTLFDGPSKHIVHLKSVINRRKHYILSHSLSPSCCLLRCAIAAIAFARSRPINEAADIRNYQLIHTHKWLAASSKKCMKWRYYFNDDLVITLRSNCISLSLSVHAFPNAAHTAFFVCLFHGNSRPNTQQI